MPSEESTEKIRSIVASILCVDPEHIAVNLNLFDLGLDSISLVQLFVRVEEEYGLNDLKVTDFYEASTVEGCAAVVERNLSEAL